MCFFLFFSSVLSTPCVHHFFYNNFLLNSAFSLHFLCNRLIISVLHSEGLSCEPSLSLHFWPKFGNILTSIGNLLMKIWMSITIIKSLFAFTGSLFTIVGGLFTIAASLLVKIPSVGTVLETHFSALPDLPYKQMKGSEG